MKKFISLFILIILLTSTCFSLAGCGADKLKDAKELFSNAQFKPNIEAMLPDSVKEISSQGVNIQPTLYNKKIKPAALTDKYVNFSDIHSYQNERFITGAFEIIETAAGNLKVKANTALNGLRNENEWVNVSGENVMYVRNGNTGKLSRDFTLMGKRTKMEILVDDNRETVEMFSTSEETESLVYLRNVKDKEFEAVFNQNGLISYHSYKRDGKIFSGSTITYYKSETAEQFQFYYTLGDDTKLSRIGRDCIVTNDGTLADDSYSPAFINNKIAAHMQIRMPGVMGGNMSMNMHLDVKGFSGIDKIYYKTNTAPDISGTIMATDIQLTGGGLLDSEKLKTGWHFNNTSAGKSDTATITGMYSITNISLDANNMKIIPNQVSNAIDNHFAGTPISFSESNFAALATVVDDMNAFNFYGLSINEILADSDKMLEKLNSNFLNKISF